MTDKDNIKLHNRLFIQMYVSYAVVLTVLAVSIGVIFMNIYVKTTTSNYHRQLLEQAENISETLQRYIINEAYDEALSYTLQLEQLDEKNEIWVIQNPKAEHPMSSTMETNSIKNIHQKDFLDVIHKAFQNKSIKRNFYSSIHMTMMNVIGVPVKGVNDEVVGALVYSSPADAQQSIIRQSIRIIITSIICAFLISIVLANRFVQRITRPILKMRNTAHRLADGDYTAKTEVKRKDEIGQLANTVDILADKLLENETERKNLDQMRLDFFANVSHELRTPITVVRAYTETLYDRVVTDEATTMQYYERMLLECKSMERLVGDLLLLSKMQNPDFEVEKEPVNINQIFDDIFRSASAISEEKNVSIEMTREEGIILMMGDYDRLRQMFMVILDNAIKFSKENSKVHINIEKKETLDISIRDYGIGIAKEELPYIFDKFYRSKLRQNAKGSGLGLAIAKQIAAKHDGTIEVKSEPGEGTEFVFHFHMLTQEELEQI